MATKLRFLNPGNKPQGNQEFEQSQGNASQGVVLHRSPFAVNKAPPSAKGVVASPKASPTGADVRILRVFFNLVGAAPAQLILPQSASVRSFCIIRNASTSAGSVYVGFGYPPLGVETCDFELTAGQVLFLDIRVPQDDVWLASDVGAAGNVSYSLARARTRGR